MLPLRVTAPRALLASRVVTCRPAVVRPRVVVRALDAPAPLPEAASPQLEAEAQKEVARAVYRYVRGSPNKVRRVLDVIRGRTYEDALGMLEYMPYRACEPILKVLLSAAANAKNNLGLRKSRLVVTECFCDEGPVMKRFRCRAQGRAYKIKKKTSHITIKVAEADKTD